jgi:glycosyltransferase involved in cell wall biosynthesis
MRITFVLPYAGLSGGVRVTAIYAERLQQRGHEVLVVSTVGYSPPRQWRRELKRWLRDKSWLQKPERSRPPSHIDTINVPHHVVQSGYNVTDEDLPDADVVIATWWETAEWVSRLSASKGAKAYFIQHHEVFDYLPIDRVKATYTLPFQKVAVAQWLVDLMRTEYDDENTALVLNSVDTQQFNAPPRSKRSVPTVGLMYAQAPWKGCKESFAAIARVAETMPNLRVIAFGDSAPVSHLPLPPNTEYICSPPQAQIKEIYAQCDVWVCGSSSEGFGLPMVEAMACRCPVVSTEVGGAKDLIQPGVNGYLAAVGDIEQLAAGIEKVLSCHEAEWRSLSDAAYETVTRYTWDDATDRLEAVLYQMIEPHAEAKLPKITRSQAAPGLVVP